MKLINMNVVCKNKIIKISLKFMPSANNAAETDREETDVDTRYLRLRVWIQNVIVQRCNLFTNSTWSGATSLVLRSSIEYGF